MDNMRSMRNSVLYIVVAMMLVAFLVVSLTRNGQGNTPTMDIGEVAKLARGPGRSYHGQRPGFDG